MFGATGPTAYDVRFRLFGIPVRIQPFFWLIALFFFPLLGAMENMATWFFALAGWVGAWLGGFLIHEFGHALVLRKIYGASPWIVLYGFGGAAIHEPYYRRLPGNGGRMLIAFAGPGAELLCVALLIGVLSLFGFDFTVGLASLGPVPIPMVISNDIIQMMVATAQPIRVLLGWFLFGFLWLGVFWSIVNLFPIQPLDGGHIMRQFCDKIDPRGGVRNSLIISMICALAVAAFCLRERSLFVAMFFGFFAYANYQELTSRRF